ncbi:hypothetical protein DACRYDRAFT_94529 [Dacryopinax primogenitus]|uniref:Splicing arginine serine-rich 12 n=1 Tax=Dacryopinax primogenitus (strain DJM 731) TaxID=1858805 RepID=M5GE07_DACPD|nr:uncharacterized protein DACRYDRAFT_94529 [Dacryopinax primogenitus]EJU02868.1 hypothetical protein DACRYDRAFT_94529 [Dacryopinax primogenitus]
MSTRSRTPSPRPHKRRRHTEKDERSPTPSEESEVELPYGAKEISEKDYYAKNDEFRVWLKDEKRRYFDELSGEKARSYFKKFVRSWNRGRLPRSIYAGINSSSTAPASQTAFRWSFTDQSNRAEREALERARGDVGSATWGKPSAALSETPETERRAGPSRVAGPTLPSASDLRFAQESAEELRAQDRSRSRALDKRDARDRLEEVAPREVGRERMLEKKREKREADRSFRDKGDDAGLEMDDKSLMGGDSFQDRLRQRDAAKSRFEEKKRTERMELEAERNERTRALREKEQGTMEMFKKMAKERFG